MNGSFLIQASGTSPAETAPRRGKLCSVRDCGIQFDHPAYCVSVLAVVMDANKLTSRRDKGFRAGVRCSPQSEFDDAEWRSRGLPDVDRRFGITEPKTGGNPTRGRYEQPNARPSCRMRKKRRPFMYPVGGRPRYMKEHMNNPLHVNPYSPHGQVELFGTSVLRERT